MSGRRFVINKYSFLILLSLFISSSISAESCLNISDKSCDNQPSSQKSQLEIDHKECTKMAGGKEPNIFQKLGAVLNPSLAPQLSREYKEPNQELWRLCMKERGYDL